VTGIFDGKALLHQFTAKVSFFGEKSGWPIAIAKNHPEKKPRT
jgi:hypothetical protein